MSQPELQHPTEPTTAESEPEGLSLTDKAIDQVRLIRDREGLEAHYLRVSVVGGGCSGMSYRMGFVDSLQEHDQVLEKGGVRVIVDPKSALYLDGTVVDFTDGLNGTGFTFKNPKASRTCGCGSSFSA